MGYGHISFRVDLHRARSLFGSGDEALARAVLKKQADDVESNDACFEDKIEDGICPDTATALREILAGQASPPRQTSMYGYMLKILCQQVGKEFGEEVAAIGEHPYESQLASSGPPVPIPYDARDFPQIGYLELKDIPAEIARLDAAPRIVTPQRWALLDEESLNRDMDAYRLTLEQALKKKGDVIAFRH